MARPSSRPDPSLTRAGFDAVLLVSFGGPESAAAVLPFLRRVTAGRGVPDDRLAEVAEHYYRFGGSPINGQNRALRAALTRQLAPLPVYWGNRNAAPFLVDEVRRMRDDGVRRAACLVTSAFSSYSGCRQYRENLADARAALGPDAPELVKLRAFFDHPGFVAPMIDNTRAALAELLADLGVEPDAEPGGGSGAGSGATAPAPRLVFVAHSIPLTAAATSGPTGGAYQRQLAATSAVIAAAVAAETGIEVGHDLVFCSRSGPPSVPWLGPDVGDHLAALAAAGVTGAVLVPIGFVSDHMEVVYDLDVEAARRAQAAGIAVRRAATVGTDSRFVAMAGALVDELAEPDTPRPGLTGLGPVADECPAGCCPAGAGRRPGTGEDVGKDGDAASVTSTRAPGRV
jgi:ferrochelatase